MEGFLRFPEPVHPHTFWEPCRSRTGGMIDCIPWGSPQHRRAACVSTSSAGEVTSAGPSRFNTQHCLQGLLEGSFKGSMASELRREGFGYEF